MRCGFLAFALVLAAASPALAQTAAEQPAQGQPQDAAQRFQAYVTSNGYKSFIGQIATMGDNLTAPDCKDHKPSQRAGLTIYAPPKFSDAQHPVFGLWTDHITVERCGKTAIQNILVQASSDGKPPRAALMVPGASRANPPLQDLIIKDILAGLAKKKCTDQAQIVPFDSKKEKETKALKANEKGMIVEGAWTETWTMRACGKMVNATVEISADGKGGMTHKVKM